MSAIARSITDVGVALGLIPLDDDGVMLRFAVPTGD